MTVYGRDTVLEHALIPKGAPVTAQSGDANDLTVNSSPFSVPKGAHTMTIHCPTLAGGPATLAIQALDPDTDQATEVWRTISTMTGVTAVPLTAIAASGIAMTWGITQIGGGVLRLVASATQAGAPVTVKISFHVQP